VVKTGADLDRSHSWQLGLSYIHNRREAAVEEHDHDEDAHDEGEDEVARTQPTLTAHSSAAARPG
jgi:hypothetical protein